MKKTIYLLILGLVAMNTVLAQNYDAQVLQPTHVIGKRINSSGEITKILESDFTYSDNGKLYKYDFDEFALSTTYSFEDDFLTREYTFHEGGYPVFGESINYSYENDKVKTISHLWDQMNENEYWQYDYDENGRLKQKDYKEGDGDFHQHYIYEYENNGKTRIESYWTSWVTQGLLLRRKTTSQYDDHYRPLTAQTENYNTEGALTSSTLTNYSYNPNGQEESVITQTLVEGEWVNTSIQQYIYNDLGQVIEQQNGSWQQQNGIWNITNKILFEYSDGGESLTISFYKKNGEDWAWDMFNNQTILFESYLKNQQRALRYYMYEEMNEPAKINQFEITMEQTKEPTYLETNETAPSGFSVFPNPGNSKMKVLAPLENTIIRIYNLQGKLIQAHPFDFSTEINTKDWSSGIYLWEIWHNNQKEAYGKWIRQ